MSRPEKPPGKKAFPLRLDPALHAVVERLAMGDLRSVNAQIELLLREALRARGVKLPAREPGGAQSGDNDDPGAGNPRRDP
jgi:hypothetical protein